MAERRDVGTPAHGEPGFMRPAIINTSDDVIELRQHAVVVVPCSTTTRGSLTDANDDEFGVAQTDLPTTISVDLLGP